MTDSRDAVTPEVADELRRMHAIAKTVNGATPVDDPRRAVSREFTEALAVLVEQGVTVYRLAKVLGVRHSTVYARLARYGYRAASPSCEHKAIQDATVWDSRRANQADQ
ncbi:MAG: hypothetical protein HOY75_13415 [Streptomyces sp.]|nr:hypothetical protein [Streptomyces sp.]